MSISLLDLANEEVLHRKMQLLQGMVRRNKREIAPKFEERVNENRIILRSGDNELS